MPDHVFEVLTNEREHLSGVLFRVLGFVTAEVLEDTLERNPHLIGLPLLYPENTRIVIREESVAPTVREVQTLW